MSTPPAVDIVIVNWNTGGLLRDCLAALAGARHDGYRLGQVIVVDNASSDGSATDLDAAGLPLSVIVNAGNRGFGAACNKGAARSSADYLLFLNPDTAVLGDTLARTVACMARPESASVGIIGVQLLDRHGEIARSCARFPTVRHFIGKMLGLTRLLPRAFPEHFYLDWDHRESRSVDQVMGAYFFMRGAVFRALGGFDERFFVYFEDVDLSLRARDAGWTTYYLASAQCRHVGGGSTGQIKGRRLFYSLRSRSFYAFKHFGTARATALLLATLCLEPIPRLGQAAVQGSTAGIRDILQGYRLLWGALPEILGRCFRRERTADAPPRIAATEAASERGMTLWLAIASYRNDDAVLRILEQVHAPGDGVFDRILIVDSEGTGTIPRILAERGWSNVDYRSYARNLGSGANLRERLRLAAEGGADYAWAINHDGGYDARVVQALVKAARPLDNLGAAYPLSCLTSVGLYNITGTRELPLPAKLVAAPPPGPLIDVFWSSSNGALYSMRPVRRGILPWSALWMGWEDLDYGWRLADHGYRQVIVCDAVFADNYEYTSQWFGRRMNKPAWRSYYYARNLILAIRRSRNRPLYHAVAAYKIVRECALIVLAQDSKWQRLRLIGAGTVDGWRWREWQDLGAEAPEAGR